MAHIYITAQNPNDMPRSEGKYYLMSDSDRLSPDEFDTIEDARDVMEEGYVKGYEHLWIAIVEDDQFIFCEGESA